MSATLRDVARHAGVSPTTVLRALNRNREISPVTRTAVENSVRALGYAYRTKSRSGIVAGARAPISGATTLTLLFPDKTRTPTNTTLTGELIHGIEPVLRRAGLTFTMSELTDDGALPATVTTAQVGGLLVRRPLDDIHRSFERQLTGMPVVWLFQPFYWPEIGDVVQPDNILLGRMAARHLMERRAHRFVVVRSPLPHVETATRIGAFQEELAAAGRTCQVIECDAQSLPAQRGRLLADEGGPTGFFLPVGESSTDILYRVVSESGARYGRDFELISCNCDQERVMLLDPRLPNIDIRPSLLGEVAAEALLWRIAHPDAPQRVIFVRPVLTAGCSVGEPPTV